MEIISSQTFFVVFDRCSREIYSLEDSWEKGMKAPGWRGRFPISFPIQIMSYQRPNLYPHFSKRPRVLNPRLL